MSKKQRLALAKKEHDLKIEELVKKEIKGDNKLFVHYQEEPEPETITGYIKDIIAYAVFIGSVLVLAYAITEAIFT